MSYRPKNTYILSTKCYLSDINQTKTFHLADLLKEYTKLCNLFINELWNNRYLNNEEIPNRFDKIDYSLFESDLSSRLRNCCINQASSIVRARIEQINQFVNSRKYRNPVNKKQINQNKVTYDKLHVIPFLSEKEARIDSKCSTINQNENIDINLDPKTKHFDISITLSSLGIFKSKDEQIVILLRKHPHFIEHINNGGKLLNGIIITETYVQFSFEFTKQPQTIIQQEEIGIDIGCKTLLSVSNDKQLTLNDKGKSYHQIVTELSKKKQGSKSFKRKSDERNNCIGYCVNRLNLSQTKQLNLENIQYLRYKKRTSKLLKHWNYDYIFDRLESICLKQNVFVNKIDQRYTSQRCNNCGYTHYNNRKSEHFKCLDCGFATNADLNASKNINIVNKLYPIPEYIKSSKANRSSGFYWLLNRVSTER